jgi:GH25 family lysozyme M1 (1,4-beta-N-acetylmuramidase)
VVVGLVRRISLVMGVAVIAVVGLAVPASSSTGIDVSSWNHPNGAGISWTAVRDAGHSFAFIKADEGPVSTGGKYYVNPYFGSDWAGAGAAGLYRGAYHFARPKLPLSTAVQDARHFVSITGTMRGPRDLPPVLDLEATGGLSGPNIIAWSKSWLHEVERLTGRRPIVYTGYYFWQDTLNATSELAPWRLWLPWYTTASQPGRVPAPWGTWTFWQYTETGRVPGIVSNTDINRYCCSAANLAALADGGGSAGASNPFGSFDGAVRSPNELTVWGWGIDPDTTNPIKMHVYVNDVFKGEVTANRSRGDLDKAYPGFGANHGFEFKTPVGGGSQRVCVFAINVGAGTTNPLLGCKTVSSSPVGAFDTIKQEPGGVLRLSGWAIDPDSAGPIDVGVWVNGRPWLAAKADQSRSDVQAAFSLVSDKHGFSIPITGVGKGKVEVCVFGVNVGPGSPGYLGCRSITVGEVPFGSIDAAEVGSGGMRVRGWAIDPDVAGPIDMHFYVDGAYKGVAKADQSRPDVGSAFPGYGSNHGFDTLLTGLTNARHQVCVYAINVGAGWGNPMFGCRFVNPTGHPFGSFDFATPATGGVRAVGWAIDPDTVAPIDVALYVNGVPTVVVADIDRPDVASGFAGFGPGHGFDVVLPTGPGTKEICAWAVNVATGFGNQLLGCRTVAV